jgi:N-acetylglutamate synthase-like GNAT family acetyltransferase
MPAQILVRTATPDDARRIHRLITTHAAEGHLLARTRADVTEHAGRFLVASRCRGRGVGRTLINRLRLRARRAGFEQLCAFTHSPEYFLRLDFSIVSHASVPEKIETDCRQCPLFGRCGQYALVDDLGVAAAPHVSPIVVLPAR